MANKKIDLGKVLAQVQHLRVRQVPTFEGIDKKRRMVSSYIGIFNVKKELAKGFKDTDAAVYECKKMLKLI